MPSDHPPAIPGKKATMKDIAKLCGVSPMAVSMALGGKRGVSKETAERIQAAAKQLNYTPNLIAKSLRVNETRTLGVVIADSSHLLFAKLLRAIGDTAEQEGYNIIISNTGQNRSRERRSVDALVNKRIDGLLLAAPINVDANSMENISNLHLPTVLLMRSGGPDFDTVINDNYHGGFKMAEYLLSTGADQIHMINLPEDSQSGCERLRGYQDCLICHGKPYDPTLVRNCLPEISAGEAVMEEFLQKGVRTGTVMCGCDVIAIGAMRAIHAAGLRIPEDIRVSGYDDIELLDDLKVPLTTMRQPIATMGEEGIRLLIRRIKNPESPPERIVLTSTLVKRQSA